MTQGVSDDVMPPQAVATAVSPDAILTVWEKVIDLQMHFNEMCMNLRRTAIGTVGALLAAGALAFRFGGLVHVFGRDVSSAVIFVAVALLVWSAFYLMDRYWYHELLRAAVKYAEGLSAPASAAGLTITLDMSQQIRAANHAALGMSGGKKINLFYSLVAAALVVAILSLYFGLVQPAKTP